MGQNSFIHAEVSQRPFLAQCTQSRTSWWRLMQGPWGAVTHFPHDRPHLTSIQSALKTHSPWLAHMSHWVLLPYVFKHATGDKEAIHKKITQNPYSASEDNWTITYNQNIPVLGLHKTCFSALRRDCWPKLSPDMTSAFLSVLGNYWGYYRDVHLGNELTVIAWISDDFNIL